MKSLLNRIARFSAFASVALALTANAEVTVDYDASVEGAAGFGRWTPHYISALSHGRFSSSRQILVEGLAKVDIDTTKRFSWGAGIDLIVTGASAHNYARYNSETGWYTHSLRPEIWRVQQLYGAVKWRGVVLNIGAMERMSALLNHRLSSGDLIESGNARPIPQARVGFIDFQNIPFTNGWVQIQGEVAFGKMTDSDWWREHYNRFNYHVNEGQWYNYQRCYFRTKPTERFSVTLGMQAATTFGGRMVHYDRGKFISERKYDLDFSTFWKVFFPTGGGEEFYVGHHLGSWDLMARYTLGGAAGQLKAYFQWPWEDGSGIGRRNGWDGLWGLEWNGNGSTWINGVVVEYLDMTNQSGPQHYAPGDLPGTTITTESTGADDYYNNQMYNAYAIYGVGIGTPMVMSPIYNLDGYLGFIGNRMRGCHIAAEGDIMPGLKWRVMGGYRKAWGSGRVILREPIHSTSFAADVRWAISAVPGFNVKGQLGFDAGTMPGNSFGALFGVSYVGELNFGHKR